MSTSSAAILFKNFDKLYSELRSYLHSRGLYLTGELFLLLCCIGSCNGGTSRGIHDIYRSSYSGTGYRSFVRRLSALCDVGLVDRSRNGRDGRVVRYRLSRSCLALVRRSVGSDVLASFSVQPKND